MRSHPRHLPARLPRRRTAQPVAHSALTLVELLVVVTIIGALVALLLPAVQAARESARRTECQNDLRQLGVAMQLHADRHAAYPIGCIGGRRSADKRCISWNVQLLPFLEYWGLWELFDLSRPSYDPLNRPVGEFRIGTFLCPSTDASEIFSAREPWKGAAFTDYGGLYGVEGTGHDAPAGSSQALRDESLGVMLNEVAVEPPQITDGLSKTACLAELSLRRVPTMNEWVNGLNIFAQEHSTPINGRGLNNEIGSPHPGGASLVFCDGHVEFVAESIDQPLLNAMLTKAGGER